MQSSVSVQPLATAPIRRRPQGLAVIEAGGVREMTLHMGPQHPSTHGVLHLVLGLAGETVTWVDPDIGFVHRGVEKLCESLPWDSIAPVLERNDYLSPPANSHAFVLAAEALGNIEVPGRGAWLRCLGDELGRIASHLVAWGTFGMDLGGALGGGATLFLHCFRERERILDLFQSWTGARFHPNLSQIGGARYDLPAGFDRQAEEALAAIEAHLDELQGILESNPVFGIRTRGVGVLEPELALRLGCSGPALRASGVDQDLRRRRPYGAYAELDFRTVTQTGCDAHARYRCRVEEISVSMSLVRQMIGGLPAGPIHGRAPVRSAKHKMPVGTAYAAVESPRGELGVWVRGDNAPSPTRVRLRSPSFANLKALMHILPGHLVADIVSILGSLDPVFGDVDR